MDPYSLAAYEYHLPKELIAQHPVEPRENARLMCINKRTGEISHQHVRDLIDLLTPNDLLIFNNTKVLPARLYGYRKSGGKSECLLLRRYANGDWECLTRPAKKLVCGSLLKFSEEFSAEILEDLGEGKKRVAFHTKNLSFEEALEKWGQMPLPPYIERNEKDPKDALDYQTIFAQEAGAVAAPTASLHFRESFLKQVPASWTTLTLHVGLGTFKPVVVEDIREHPMHFESYSLSQETANTLNSTKGKKRHIAVGTTSCRVLESLRYPFEACSGDTDIFIYPGYSFASVDAFITNFHLPGSTLIMLVSAYLGRELCLEAYAKAVENKYRFYSYGDAMFLYE